VRRISWWRHVARMEEFEKFMHNFGRILNGRDHLGDLGVEGSIILS
jgi:hypothetical protein